MIVVIVDSYNRLKKGESNFISKNIIYFRLP